MSGPAPKYQPLFTDQEVEEARRVAARHQEAHVRVQRAQMVLVLHEDPRLPTPHLAVRVRVHPNTAAKWRKRWATEGFTLDDRPRSGRPPLFSAVQVAQVKATACQMPAERGLPLSRFSLSEVQQEVQKALLITSISTATIWRILHEDAIRPWYHRAWIFPRDPQFIEKAGRVLDLYQQLWEGFPLESDTYIISADEKTQIQALGRSHPTVPAGPDQPMRVEYEYHRGGTVAYLTALDVFSGTVFGRVEPSTGIEPFQRLVNQVMQQEPYASARRVFWIVDNGSSHHPSTFPQRLHEAYPNAVAVHLPLHASWLNQIELYFSIVQRKVLTPNDFENLTALEERLMAFQERYNRMAQPFRWRFTRKDLEKRLRQAA
jgi:transposase